VVDREVIITSTSSHAPNHAVDHQARAEPRATRVRYFVLVALALTAILSYILRVSPSTAGTTIQKELALDDVTMGNVFSGFFVGYFWFQIPAGWLGNRVGARRALGAMALLWAVAIALASSASSVRPLYWSLAALGAAQAGLFPVMIIAIRNWFPPSSRGRASSTITSCMSIGSILASGLTVRLLGPLGWRGAFQAFALLAIVWAFVLYLWLRDTPEAHPAVNDQERDLIRSESEDSATRSRAGSSMPAPRAVLVLLRSPSFLAFCTQGFFQAFGYAFFITWFPAYLERSYGVGRIEAGDLMMIPLIGTVLGSLAGGYILDAVLTRTGSRRLSRSGVSIVSLALCAATFAIAIAAKEPRTTVAIVGIGMFLAGIAKPTQWAASIDLCGAQTAIGFALMNMTGNLGAITCPIVVGRMFDRLSKTGGDWNSVLYLIAGIHLAAAFTWLLVDPNKPARGAET
jgi:sugar phosphate permease